MKSKVLYINLSEKNWEVKEEEAFGIIDFGVKLHLDRETYKWDVYSDKNIVIFGVGKFAGSNLPGTHRLVFVFRSPLTKNLYSSTLGGAGVEFVKTGLDFVVIEGKAEKPTIITIENFGQLKVEFKEGEIEGVYSLSKKLEREGFRVLCMGPAAFKTSYGAVVSIKEGVADFAGRGGAGSVLARAHNVLAIAFGGNQAKNLPPYNLSPIMGKILEKTKKYRFNPEINSGGTFGSNYPSLKSYTLVFNWQNPNLDIKEREEIWKNYVLGDKWWKEFNREVIEPRKFKTCGENCPVACKKMYEGEKVDYEPYEALLNGGIFDLKKARDVAKFVDDMGFDAINLGNIVGAVFESLIRGKIRKEDLKLDEIPRFFEPENEKAGEINARLYLDLVKKILEGGTEVLEKLRDDPRSIIGEFLVYTSFEKGYITPSFYWAIGNFMPSLLPGTYWLYYHFGVFPEPEELAKKSFENMIKECTYDNLGICRFHRGWITDLINQIIKEFYGIELDAFQISKQAIKGIYEYMKRQNNLPKPEFSRRIIDLFDKGAKEFGNEKWVGKIKEYWEKYWETYQKLLDGL